MSGYPEYTIEGMVTVRRVGDLVAVDTNPIAKPLFTPAQLDELILMLQRSRPVQDDEGAIYP